MNARPLLFLALPPLALVLGLAQDPGLLKARNYACNRVERPLERILETEAGALDSNGASALLTLAPSRPVAPGLVAWHADFAAACAAAESSGKPVLLFQLLGRLDDELC